MTLTGVAGNHGTALIASRSPWQGIEQCSRKRRTPLRPVLLKDDTADTVPVVGLIDRLGDRALDSLTEVARERRLARREFRARLVNELRTYSVRVEETRVAFLRARGRILAGDLSQTDLPPGRIRELAIEDSEAAARTLHVDREALAASGLDTPALRNAYRVADTAILHSIRGSSQQSETAQRASELDDAWAQVRPLLDDALEYEAIAYLRRYRHELRYLIEDAENGLRRLLRSDSSATDNQRYVLALVDQVLVAADLWNHAIVGIRNDFRTDR